MGKVTISMLTLFSCIVSCSSYVTIVINNKNFSLAKLLYRYLRLGVLVISSR